MENHKNMMIAVVGIIITALVAWGPIVSSKSEHAKYEVIQKSTSIEIRDYNSIIIAQVEIPLKDRKAALSEGFRLIADYIFGNNITKEKIAMTVPVMQQEIENAWQIRFLMPSEYDMNALPKPSNQKVNILSLDKKRFAVISFLGLASDINISQNTEKLREFIKLNKLKSKKTPIYAFFNPPWTLPFLRHNEIMIELVL